MTGQHYTCDECGQLIEGADYDHAPTCSAFAVAPLVTVEPLAPPKDRMVELEERLDEMQALVDEKWLTALNWRNRAEAAEAERNALAQTMWEARAILGFDNDGDKTPHAAIAGMGWEGYRRSFLEDMRQQRQDYDEALDAIPDA